jgi:hypothetical protein
MNEITQREKRQVMENDRRRVREATTYCSVAQAALDDERGGRYAAGSGSKASVVGTSPVSYPQQPAGSPWAKDECPPEPPLGYSVETLEPVGELHEVEASRSAGDVRPVTKSFVRRF